MSFSCGDAQHLLQSEIICIPLGHTNFPQQDRLLQEINHQTNSASQTKWNIYFILTWKHLLHYNFPVEKLDEKCQLWFT